MKKLFLFTLMSLLLFIGGCNTLKNMINKNNNTTDNEFVRVQEYNGEGYTLRGGQEEAAEIAEEHREEVEEAVQEYFLKNYHTEVKVHQFIGAQDAVSVTAEAVGEPFFYTFAIVPVDFRSKELNLDDIWTLEGEVEQGIKSGLYVMAYAEEFTKLNNYLEQFENEYPVVGVNKTVRQNTNVAHGYATPHYFISVTGETFKILFDEFMINPNMSINEVQQLFTESPVDPEYINLSIEFFMEEEKVEPNQEILDRLVSDIEKMTDIPKGSYFMTINDNYINKSTTLAKNAISNTYPDQIIKK